MRYILFFILLSVFTSDLLYAQPQSVFFGFVSVGDTSLRHEATTISAAPVIITQYWIGGNDSSEFSLTTPHLPDTVGSSNDSVRLTITFHPVSPAHKNAVVYARTNHGVISLFTLYGTAQLNQSVSSAQEHEHIISYPEPFFSQTTLIIHDARKIISLALYDLNGKKITDYTGIITQNLSQEELRILIQNVHPGTYFIVAKTESGFLHYAIHCIR